MTANFDVPADQDGFECPYCEAVEPTARLRTLHKAERHYETLSEREIAAYEETYKAEQARIRRFRLAALGALVLLYFGLLLTYAIVT